jgi:hypothetical protein
MNCTEIKPTNRQSPSRPGWLRFHCRRRRPFNLHVLDAIAAGQSSSHLQRLLTCRHHQPPCYCLWSPTSAKFTFLLLQIPRLYAALNLTLVPSLLFFFLLQISRLLFMQP